MPGCPAEAMPIRPTTEKGNQCRRSPERVGAGGGAEGAEAAGWQHLGLADGLHVGADLAAVPRPPRLPLRWALLRAAARGPLRRAAQLLQHVQRGMRQTVI